MISLAAAIDKALDELGISTWDFAKMTGAPSSMVEKWRALGIAPRSKYFEPVMSQLGLDPSEYGFERKQNSNS